MGGVPASTYSPGFGTGPAPSARKPASSSRLPLALLIGCRGLAMVGAVVGIGLTIWLTKLRGTLPVWLTSPEQGSTSAASATNLPQQEVPGGPIIIQRGDHDPTLIDVPINLKAFDIHGFLPQALKLAQRYYSDAQLTSIYADGIRPNGLIALSEDDDFDVIYSFRSPSRSVPPPSHPTNKEYEGNCTVIVYIDGDGVRANSRTWECTEPLAPTPKCTPVQIWSHAAREGASTGNVVGSLHYFVDTETKDATWSLSVPPEFSRSFPDGC